MGYVFKVGDKGKTRAGQPYEVIAVVPENDVSNVVFALVAVRHCVPARQACYTYSIGGSYVEGEENDFDLLPPAQTVWVNFYRGGDAYFHDSEAQARIGARDGSGGVSSEVIAAAVPVELPGGAA